MEKREKVTICIPVYNGEKTIERAIKSALNQSFISNCKIIICDNASTDNTGNVVKKYLNESVKYFRNSENIGMIGNWNKCLEISKGEYVLLLHHDDVLNRNILKYEVEIMEKNKSIGIIGSYELTVYGISILKLKKIKNLLKNFLITTKEGLNNRNIDYELYEKGEVSKFIKCGHYFPCSSVLIRKSILDQVGMFSEEYPYSPDEEYWSRILTSYDIARIKRRYVKRFLHGENFEYKSWAKKDFPLIYMKVYQKLWKYCKYDPNMLNLFTTKWLSTMEHVKNYIDNNTNNKEMVQVYEKWIKKVKNEKGDIDIDLIF